MTAVPRQPLGRRGALVLLGGATLAACTSSPPASLPSTSPPSGSPSTPSASPTVSESAGPTLPAVRRWRPSSGELEPACKLAAVRLLERRGTTDTQALEVLDAQYGGLLATSASVLVPCRTWRLVEGRVVAGGRTYDVRLTRVSADRWQVGEVHPSTPGPPAPRLTGAARRVLAEDRIDLPPAARADVASGRVHDSVLTALLALARTYRIGVSVVRSGHPTYVFGTDRLSDHPRGRAVDTWRIDGRPVVGAPERLVSGYMRAAAEVGAYNVGGPYLLGSAPQYFSDATHHDHVHAGFGT